MGAHVGLELLGHLLGIHLFGHAEVNAGAGDVRHGVDGLFHRGGGKSGDAHGDAGPQLVRDGALVAGDDVHALEHAGILGKVLGGVLQALPPHGVVQAVDGDKAVLVAQRIEGADEGEGGIGGRAAELAGVGGGGHRLDGDVHLATAAQAGGQRGHAHLGVTGVDDADDVGLEQLGVGVDEGVEPLTADLLGALDDDAEVAPGSSELLDGL